MRIAVGSDHAGFDLKARLAKHLADGGHQVVDLGTDSPDISVDYPEFGQAVGEAVADGRVDLGLCVCGTGIGISMAANKVRGIRAALVHDVTTAGLAREHNDANVICLGGRTTGGSWPPAPWTPSCTLPMPAGATSAGSTRSPPTRPARPSHSAARRPSRPPHRKVTPTP